MTLKVSDIVTSSLRQSIFEFQIIFFLLKITLKSYLTLSSFIGTDPKLGTKFPDSK